MKFSLPRFFPALFACAFVAFSTAQTQAQSPAARLPPGVVLVAKVEGRVEMTVNGQVTALAVDMQIPQAAKVVTYADAAVVLVFSNGATTRLGTDTELILEEFLQDPFGATIKVAELQEEPSASVTSLRLNRGELVGDVKKLKYGQGSSFTINTPVGAAGIRGTTFRIVFRPAGTGQAFFSLTTATGNVVFQQGQQGQTGGAPVPGAGQTQGQTQPPDPGQPQQQQGQTQPQGQGSGGTPTTGGTVTTTGVVSGLSVPQGQEIVITVSVNQTAAGMVVTSQPAVPTATQAISSASLQAVTNVAREIAVAVQQAVFTSTTPAPAASGSGSSSAGAAGSGTGTPTGSSTAAPGGSGSQGSGTAGGSGTATGGSSQGSASGAGSAGTGSTTGSAAGTSGGSVTGSTTGSTTGSVTGSTTGSVTGSTTGSTSGSTGSSSRSGSTPSTAAAPGAGSSSTGGQVSTAQPFTSQAAATPAPTPPTPPRIIPTNPGGG